MQEPSAAEWPTGTPRQVTLSKRRSQPASICHMHSSPPGQLKVQRLASNPDAPCRGLGVLSRHCACSWRSITGADNTEDCWDKVLVVDIEDRNDSAFCVGGDAAQDTCAMFTCAHSFSVNIFRCGS